MAMNAVGEFADGSIGEDRRSLHRRLRRTATRRRTNPHLQFHSPSKNTYEHEKGDGPCCDPSNAARNPGGALWRTSAVDLLVIAAARIIGEPTSPTEGRGRAGQQD